MTRPNIQIPNEFAINGEKADFTQEKIQTGFDKLDPDIFAGDNLNKFVDDTYKGLNGVLDLYNGVVLHEMTTTYDDKAVVGKFIENNFKLYRSLVNDNTGHEVTETEYWEEVALGGGGSGLDGRITNCITEIPQDIKLEHKDGTLTLKAGSKVYVPNGFEADGSTPKFDVVVIESDLTNATTGGAKMFLTVYNNGTNLFAGYTTGETVTERPVSPTNYALYYNTTTNKVEFYNGSNWVSNCSFPISLYTRGSIGATSIDQTFNGFGYIGSTVFALPNVKGLIPNGRNEDGTLNNIECSFSKVVTQTNTVQYSGNIALQTDNFDLASGYYYDEETNYNRLSDGRIFYRCVAGKFVKGANGVITSFNTTQPFRAVDYSDYVNGVGSTKAYITETYQNGASGYIVYSNGYCEQWGIVSFSAGQAIDNGGTVTYLKPFKDTNYNGLASINNRPGFTKTVGMFNGGKTATSFSWGVDNEGGTSQAGTFTWKVWGYIR